MNYMTALIDSGLQQYSISELAELKLALTKYSPSGRPDFSNLTARQRQHLTDIALAYTQDREFFTHRPLSGAVS